jgi:L-rhamnose mutarotase
MIRRAFTMRLKPGGLAGYREQHENIWPELVEEIERSGIAQITIFENDPVLVLYSEIRDAEAWDRLWATEVHNRWGAVMNDYMAVDASGAPEFSELREVFHIEPASQ